MRRGTAAIGSAVFFAAAPGVVVGLVPWWLTGWDLRLDWPLAVRVVGLVLLVLGVAGLVQAFVRFVVEGLGTPSPVAPTERLVVGGHVGRRLANDALAYAGSQVTSRPNQSGGSKASIAASESNSTTSRWARILN